MPSAEIVGLGLHRRNLFALRAGDRLPHPCIRLALTERAAVFARARLREAGQTLPADDMVACAASCELASQRS